MGATFVARSYDVDAKHLAATLQAAWEHKGTSFVEIYQNCNIFNDGAFSEVTDKANRGVKQLRLEQGKPMLYADGTQGLVARDGGFEVVSVGEGGVSVDDLAVHDATRTNPSRAFALAQLNVPEFPVPMGILRQIERPTYEDLASDQIEQARAAKTPDVNALLHSGYTWTVE